ncbi:hypothetical protein E1162_02680 [Rhodobacteraceae bacterium RKSG542]|uniref:hypothetical protein n=1 Tax=Pseudovibrio flavus TaxID=2529854 RepID=UPI0012BD293A|nr:hypothetical protein [Pseudovibrio flavus]MTI16139.1 hypothetical protein [Pseudovibrio flavus]
MQKLELGRKTSTQGMVDYHANSSAQQSIILGKDEEIRSLVRRMGAQLSEFRIVDYGCGPGPSAIQSVKPALEAYRGAGHDGPVVVSHADQPGNDWNGLFQLVFGGEGYQQHIPNVRSQALVGSFYKQLTGEGSVDLALCFAASHWLSRAVRVHSPNTLWFADLTGAAREEMVAFAEQDWKDFLTLRAKELKSGGYLFLSTLGSFPDAQEKNGAAASGRGIYRALYEVAQGMLADGMLRADVLDTFLFSLWFLTADEARKPLVEDEFLSCAYSVECIEVVPAAENPDDFFAPLAADKKEYAQTYTGYIRAFADSTLRANLFGPSATNANDEEAISAEFYNRLCAIYETRGAEFAFELWHLNVVLKRN